MSSVQAGLQSNYGIIGLVIAYGFVSQTQKYQKKMVVKT